VVALESRAGNVGSEVEIASGSVLLQNGRLPYRSAGFQISEVISLNIEDELAYFREKVR
jgi:hypothetical protein